MAKKEWWPSKIDEALCMAYAMCHGGSLRQVGPLLVAAWLSMARQTLAEKLQCGSDALWSSNSKWPRDSSKLR